MNEIDKLIAYLENEIDTAPNEEDMDSWDRGILKEFKKLLTKLMH